MGRKKLPAKKKNPAAVALGKRRQVVKRITPKEAREAVHKRWYNEDGTKKPYYKAKK